MRYLVSIMVVCMLVSVSCADTVFNSHEVLTATKLNTAFGEKVNKIGDTMTGKLIVPSLNFNGVDITATGTEINRLTGITGNVQTQLNTQAALINDRVLTQKITGTLTNNVINNGSALAIQSVNSTTETISQLASIDGTSSSISVRDFDVNTLSYVVASTTEASMFGPKIIITHSAAAPSSASATGTEGEVRFDTNYIYRCTATNTWKRSAISTW